MIRPLILWKIHLAVAVVAVVAVAGCVYPQIFLWP